MIIVFGIIPLVTIIIYELLQYSYFMVHGFVLQMSKIRLTIWKIVVHRLYQ